MDKSKNKSNKILLGIQLILTLLGTILSVVLLIRTITTGPTFLGILGSIVYVISYIALIFYATRNYKKKENIYFQGVIYAYAALLGIQILQAGNFISDYGLAPNVVLLINCCNIISFANVIKFADNLDTKKVALAYILIAVMLKLIVELYLIVKMFAYIQLIHILISLSIPLLGVIIILTYIHRIKRLNKVLN